MGVGLFERIQAKIELFRLEQRYTRRRHRRSTFVSNATYVDGEYVYNTPNTTGSSVNSSKTNSTREMPFSPDVGVSSPKEETPARKVSNRWSTVPGFGSSSTPSKQPSMESVSHQKQNSEGGYMQNSWGRSSKRVNFNEADR